MDAEALFWIVHLPLMFLFLVGMADVLGIWLRGRVAGQAGASAGQKARALLRAVLGAVFSRRFPLLVRAFVCESWFNRRLWQTNRWRWLSHFMLLSGFMLLMLMSGLGALADKLLEHVFHLGHVPWIGMWYNPDHPVTAVLNEVGGLMMTVGFLFFAVRRYVFRVSQLRTGPMDTWMVVGLGLILLSGWVTEIVRLNSGHVDGAAAFLSFVACPLSRLVAGWRLPWDALFDWMYVGHGLLTSVVIATIPYSKFMHVIAGGLVAMVNRFREETVRGAGEKGAAHVRA